MELKLEKDEGDGHRGSRLIQDIVKGGIHQLMAAGIENPRLETEVLLAYFLQLSRHELYTKWDQKLKDSYVAEFESLIARRISHEPLSYITSQREFWSLDFFVTPAVLIPRPETEFLVEAVLNRTSGQARIIDVGTGSGNIAISLAKERPRVHIYALDLSELALHIARLNAIRHGVLGQVIFLQTDLLTPFAQNQALRYIDCIVSNPPYIPSLDIPSLAPEINRFEPRLALDGGNDGLACFRRLIREAREVLKIGGWLIMEMGCGQKDWLSREIHEQGYQIQEIIPDYSGLDRVIVAKLCTSRPYYVEG